jgi:selenocysteine lyase/cysteine desulfurase
VFFLLSTKNIKKEQVEREKKQLSTSNETRSEGALGCATKSTKIYEHLRQIVAKFPSFQPHVQGVSAKWAYPNIKAQSTVVRFREKA